MRTMVLLLSMLGVAADATSGQTAPYGLNVIYVGSPGTDRARAFEEFLRACFQSVRVVNRDSWDVATGRTADVVVLDWPQSGAEMPPKARPLGTLDAWSTPTVLVGSAGLMLATAWDVRGGMG